MDFTSLSLVLVITTCCWGLYKSFCWFIFSSNAPTGIRPMLLESPLNFFFILLILVSFLLLTSFISFKLNSFLVILPTLTTIFLLRRKGIKNGKKIADFLNCYCELLTTSRAIMGKESAAKSTLVATCDKFKVHQPTNSIWKPSSSISADIANQIVTIFQIELLIPGRNEKDVYEHYSIIKTILDRHLIDQDTIQDQKSEAS